MSSLGCATNKLPCFGQELEDTQRLMGENFYTYGIDENRRALETLCRYSYAQGLSNRELSVEELFEPSSITFQESA